ncbi:MAG: Tim44/TimA family putative adaptor protein [Acetobacteraceae bacterium]|nr:Tim44/TimA family putative adaptor protein [Acetobacteraceae bacterium]MCX7685356.1 Tim44/TimA family putative adaptor protein [Acetobacteraceae bacterium]MDW8397696.1 Tim44/TimA family putative adaptor protein [Acetobacteraceae bacterium]
MSGGFPVDLILFAMVAAFLVLRLRSVLGRRTGFERPPRPEAAAGASPRALEPEPAPAAIAGQARQIVPDPRSPAGRALARIRETDPSFDPSAFLAGAETAFRMIVEAFAKGDRETLRMLLSEDTYAGFEHAIAERERAGHRQRTEIRAVTEAAIEAADLRGTIADVTVRFVSDQVNVTTDAAGQPVAGTDAVTELVDIWTFQRDLRSEDPTWRLVATATG